MTTSTMGERMTPANLDVTRGDSLATITINRPRALNSLDERTRTEIGEAVAELGDDDSIRSIIITGSGSKAFSAGADISELAALESAGDGVRQARHMHGILAAMNELPKPIIMAVNGYALGGGCELALAGDIIIASDNAQFGLPEVGLGIIPGFAGTQRLPRSIGRARALDMILTGDRLTAAEALNLGLVSRVVSREDLMPTAESIAGVIAQKAPLAVAMAKRAVYEGLLTNARTGGELEAAYFGVAVGTEDRREGTRAFLEKRAPQWQGR